MQTKQAACTSLPRNEGASEANLSFGNKKKCAILSQCFPTEINSIFFRVSSALSSHRNTHKRLEELKKAVQTLAYGSSSHGSTYSCLNKGVSDENRSAVHKHMAC